MKTIIGYICAAIAILFATFVAWVFGKKYVVAGYDKATEAISNKRAENALMMKNRANAAAA